MSKDTEFTYKKKNVTQTLKDLVFHSVTKVKGEGYRSKYDTTINLNEGDILIFDEERGYIKPVEHLVSIKEAIEELTCIEDLG